MADGTKDPFDFPDDPLAGVDDLDIPSFGSPEERPAVPPPLPRSAFLPPEGSPNPWESPQGFPAPQASPSPQEFPPPQASAIPPISGTDFPPPSAQPPTTPPGYGATTPPGSAPPPGAPGPVPNYAQGAGPGFPPPAPKKGRGCLFWGVLAFIAFIVLVGGCSIAGYLLVRGPIDATNKFLAAAAADDFEGAAALTAPECNLSSAQIQEDLSGLSSYSILIANTATGTGTQTGGTIVVNGTTLPFSAEMTKNASDEWAVCSYEFADIEINN